MFHVKPLVRNLLVECGDISLYLMKLEPFEVFFLQDKFKCKLAN